MVGAAGSNQTAKVTTTKLSFNAATGTISAVAKSFVIDHPTRPGMKLRYGSLEGPENGIYLRGRIVDSDRIVLPDYWVNLIDPDSISVNLTPVDGYQKLYVKSVGVNEIVVGNANILNSKMDFYFMVLAERSDIEKLRVEE
jgi:hypothetical protein